jgi:putative ABC transport system ATP-binding protein
MSTKPPILKVNNVCKQFELPAETVNVLIDINFEVPTGSFTIIYGPSGSGKSTMLNILMGLEPPTSGTVELQGQNLYQLTPDDRARFRQLTMGMVYQTNYWITSMSVEENVAFPLFLAGYDRQQAIQMAKISLETVGLDKISTHYPTQLSGGQQQRVSMARALIANPSLIIADEPTGNLDSKNGELVMNLLNDSVKHMGKTVILVTHNLDYLAYSTQQVQIKDGQLADTTSSVPPEPIAPAAPPPPPPAKPQAKEVKHG